MAIIGIHGLSGRLHVSRMSPPLTTTNNTFADGRRTTAKIRYMILFVISNLRHFRGGVGLSAIIIL